MPQPSQSTAVPALSAANRERALEQFYWLRPVLEEGVPLKRLARERGVPLRTAQRWLQRYRVSGLAGLSHQTRADRGRRRRLPTDLQEVIEGLALRKPAPSVASVYRRVCNLAAAHEWPRPSYATVYSVITPPSWRSWGEHVEVAVRSAGDGTVISMTARPFAGQLFSFGACSGGLRRLRAQLLDPKR